MDELQLAILALLQSKFAGVRKDGLQQLAAVISVQVANEEEANEVVGKLTADKVSKFVTDWRKTTDAEIAKANKTRRGHAAHGWSIDRRCYPRYYSRGNQEHPRRLRRTTRREDHSHPTRTICSEVGRRQD